MRDIEDYTNQYKTDTFELEYKVPIRRKHLLQDLQRYPHDCVLEIGCGLESIFQFAIGFKKGVIVEPSEDFACRAEGLENVVVVHSRLEDCLPVLKGNSYNFIILSCLLHELEAPSAFLQLVHSLCDEDTVVHVPNANSFHRLLGMEMQICKDTHELTERNLCMQQHTVFDSKSLEKLICETARLDGKEADICSRGSFFIKPFANSQMAACLASGAISSDVIAGLDHMIQYMPDLGSEIYINYRLK